MIVEGGIGSAHECDSDFDGRLLDDVRVGQWAALGQFGRELGGGGGMILREMGLIEEDV